MKNQGQRIDDMKKPFFLSTKGAKGRYENREVYKKVFNLRFAECTKFTNEKVKIWTTEEVSKFRDEVKAYSSNCSRFASGLRKFIEWAVTGKSDKGYESIFKGWMTEVE